MKSDEHHWTFATYRKRLDLYLRKRAQRRVLKARRVEQEAIQRAGGGKAITELMLKPAKKGCK